MTKNIRGDGPAKSRVAAKPKPAAKHPGGRPTKFKPEYVDQVRKLCAIGAIDEEIAEFFEVSRATISTWKLEHPDFLEALKLGKASVDDRVERSLLQMALGYEQDEVKIFMPAGAEKPIYAPFRAKVPASPTAAIFFLKNRRPDLWRDVHRQEVTGHNGGPVEYRKLTDEEVDARIASILGSGSTGEAPD